MQTNFLIKSPLKVYNKTVYGKYHSVYTEIILCTKIILQLVLALKYVYLWGAVYCHKGPTD